MTGTAVARDAAGRGLSVFLCEEGDLGGAASSADHQACPRRPRRHGAAPPRRHARSRHRARDPDARGAPPGAAAALPHPAPRAAVVAAGASPWPPRLRSCRAPLAPRRGGGRPRSGRAPGPLHAHFTTAFAYSDCVADDSRLVVLNAIDARARGATIDTRLRCTVAERDGGRWRLSLECARTGERSVASAKILVNAAGAAAGDVLNHVVHAREQVRMRLAKAATSSCAGRTRAPTPTRCRTATAASSMPCPTTPAPCSSAPPSATTPAIRLW